jgi:surface protein
MRSKYELNYGISPVIGVIAVAFITITIAVTVGVFAFDLGDSTKQPNTGGVTTQETDSGVQVRWVSKGNSDTVKIQINNSKIATLSNPGDSVTVTASEDDTISIIGIQDGSENTLQTLQPSSDTTDGISPSVVNSTGDTTSNQPFIITVDTTNEGTTSDSDFLVQTGDAYTGDEYTIKTDGAVNNPSELENTTGNTTIDFKNPGTYTLKIYEDVDHLQFGGSGTTYTTHDAKKVETIEQWGTIEWRSTKRMFDKATNETSNANDNPDLSNVINTSYMFIQANSYNKNVSDWNTGNVKNMSYMFYEAKSFNQNLSQWDMSNVTTTERMFACFTTTCEYNNGGQPLQWDTSSLKNTSGMFLFADSFNQDISTWEMSNVSTTSKMFFGANMYNNGGNTLSWQKVGTNAETGTNASNMFDSASSFNQDISSWNTSNITTMDGMFTDATAFNQDISNWCVSQIESTPSNFDTESGFDGNTAKQPNWGEDC